MADLAVSGGGVQQAALPVVGGELLPVSGVPHQPGHRLLLPVLQQQLYINIFYLLSNYLIYTVRTVHFQQPLTDIRHKL